MLIVACLTFYIVIFVIGAVVGSCLNAAICRTPRGPRFAGGFSLCKVCGHRLVFKDLIPVFSYLSLQRKCRYCGDVISPQYILSEITCGVLAVVSGMAFLPPIAFLSDMLPASAPEFICPAYAALYFVVLVCLFMIARIDHDTMEIPDALNITIAVCGVFAIFLGPDINLKSHLIGIAAASVPLFIAAFFIEGAFGLGDVKLMAAAGLFLGWQNGLAALIIGIIIGGVYAVYLLVSKTKNSREHFAFGPALCISIGAVMFAGKPIINWYLDIQTMYSLIACTVSV